MNVGLNLYTEKFKKSYTEKSYTDKFKKKSYTEKYIYWKFKKNQWNTFHWNNEFFK